LRLLSNCPRTALVCTLAFAVAACACSGSETPSPSSEARPPVTSTASATGTARPLLPPTAPATPVATPLPPQRLDQLALSATDLPPNFTITASGPGGPELGNDVLSSFQVEFQQRDITSTQSLQQTIVIINLLGQYKDATTALAGIRAINVQSLNQLLGSLNLNAEVASVPSIGEDAQGIHLTGDTNSISVGAYLIAFHRGPVAALVLTAAVKGAESLPQTVDLAQKQAQRLQLPP
jgi:hypothetical protein